MPGEYELQAPNATANRVCEACSEQSFSSVINAQSCAVCPLTELQPRTGQVRCLQSAYNEFVITRSDSIREKLQCPPSINPSVPEVLCGHGVLEFHDGFWHDGLRGRADRPGTHTSFLSRGEPVPKGLRFYSCPYRGANRYPSACSFLNNKTGELVCARNTAGPLCALCLPNHFHNGAGCDRCDDIRNLPWALIAVALLLVIALGACALGKRCGCCRESSTLKARREATIRRLRPVIKQMVGFACP